jgi:acetate kinase
MLTLKEAAEKLTKSEYALYLASEAKHLKKMTRRQIDLKMKKIQKEIEKLKANMAKIDKVIKSAGVEAEKLMKSKTKLKFFNEALKRLKKQIMAISSPAKKVNKKKPTTKKVTSKKNTLINKSPKTRKTTLRNTGVVRKQAHSSSRNKRSQGKRDSR